MNTSATIDDDVKAIRSPGEEFFEGVAAGDLDRRMATMVPGTIIMPPDRPSIVGRDKIRQLSHDYAAAYDEQCSLVYDEIETAGNWGFVRVTVTGTRTSKSGGRIEKVHLQNLWIVKKQPDGQWRFWRIMFNSIPSSCAT
jgi:ketosteroid isomerase-like protein